MDIRQSLDRQSLGASHTKRSLDEQVAGLPGEGGFTGNEQSYDSPASSPGATHGSTIVDGVLQSDIGVNTLLTRLKQSVASAREFAAFLKKRSALEEEQAQGLKKLCRSSHENTKKPENRQGSYAQSYDEVVRIHDRMADNGVQFALSLHQMHEDLNELATNIERGRKLWKQNGLAAEKRVQDAEALMEKAKSKYNSLAEDYDRARTGDKTSGRVFGLKGPKSAAQHEEELQRKVQQADADYASKVQAAKSQRQELVSTLRPQAVRALQELISECDSGLTLQLQKFASYNERLLLGNGLCISPLQDQPSPQNTKSLREVISRIDNAKDLSTFVASHASRVQTAGEITYERHHALASDQPSSSTAGQPMLNSILPSNSGLSQAPQPSSAPGPQSPTTGTRPANNSHSAGFGSSAGAANELSTSPKGIQTAHTGVTGPSQLPTSSEVSQTYGVPPSLPGALHNNSSSASLPALRPVFGVSLDDLLKRDGSAVPLVVYQCVQAVDLFGLDVEGIYRLSGSAASVNKLKNIFDNDPGQVDFRNPEAFLHDVNSVAGLLKQFFRDLPDPLLTHEHYQSFVEAAHIDDDILRRDSIHAIINDLPDPNYATLRALTLHLNRVQEHSGINRMNAGNLAIIFGPTLMGAGSDVTDAGWRVRTIDTILQNTYQIFDDD